MTLFYLISTTLLHRQIFFRQQQSPITSLPEWSADPRLQNYFRIPPPPSRFLCDHVLGDDGDDVHDNEVCSFSALEVTPEGHVGRPD